MQQTDFGTDNLRKTEFESACRGFWLAYVMMKTGERMENNDDDGQALRILFAN
jgi:hypothetical protein